MPRMTDAERAEIAKLNDAVLQLHVKFGYDWKKLESVCANASQRAQFMKEQADA